MEHLQPHRRIFSLSKLISVVVRSKQPLVSMSLLCERSCEYNRRNPSHHFLKRFDRGSLLVFFEQGRFNFLWKRCRLNFMWSWHAECLVIKTHAWGGLWTRAVKYTGSSSMSSRCKYLLALQVYACTKIRKACNYRWHKLWSFAQRPKCSQSAAQN